jgi:hypothetical protein
LVPLRLFGGIGLCVGFGDGFAVGLPGFVPRRLVF